ncbi:hypothetical protein AHAS_Ahas15G0166000 [Arachis hypogaea]
MMRTLTEALNFGQEATTQEALELLIELASMEPKFLRLQLMDVVGAMSVHEQTKDLKCATHLLSDKFRNMSEEKKTIVRDLGFGGLMHIPPLRVHHKVLRELANNFKLGENRMANNFLEITYPFSSGCIFSDERNMAVSKHPNREFISPKTNKEFRVEDYPMFIPFIDAKKLTSHRYAIGGYG